MNNSETNQTIDDSSEASESIEDKGQFDKTIKKRIWNQQQLSQLLGYTDQSDNTPSDNNQPSSKKSTSPQEENVVELQELFDENPRDHKTKHTFFNHPLSKVGLVALGMFVIFGPAGLIMKAMVSGGPPAVPSIHAKSSQSPNPAIKTQTTPTPEKLENGRLKASLALDSQVEAVQKVEDAKKNQSKIKASKTTPKARPQTSPTPLPKKTVPQNKTLTLQPQPYAQKTYTSPQVKNLPQPQPQQISPSQTVPDIDPIEQLQQMNRLGSYGGSQVIQVSDSSNKNGAGLEGDIVKAKEKTQQESVPKSPENLVHTLQVLPSEARIINGVSTDKYLRVGKVIRGKLLTPLIWGEQNNPTQANDYRIAQKLVIVTTKPVVVNDNQTILPENAEIIATVANIQESGFVQLQATNIVFNDKEYSVPNGAIAINADGGKPLIASKWNNKRKEVARKDAQIFVLGSLAKVGDVLNQPRSQQFSTNSGFGGSTFSSTQSGQRNILGAVLSGGFSPLTNQILQRNKKALEQIQSSEKVWFVPADTKLDIFINQSFSLN